MTFDSPEAAAQALAQAARNRDRDAMLQLFGPELDQLASDGNLRQDDEDFQRFAAAFDRSHELFSLSPAESLLFVGESDWTFPAPIVFSGGGWRFDTVAGLEEMTNRRIGRNERSAMAACVGYVVAQRRYFEMDPDGDGTRTFARQVVSDPGARNGLYWPDDEDPSTPQSPLGPAVAAAEKGALAPVDATGRRAYRGYYFKPLHRQSGAAPGGAKSYIDSDGRQTGGFALLAWPAEYGKTGVKSFCVGPDGIVREGDLGPFTSATANAANAFDPTGWTALP